MTACEKCWKDAKHESAETGCSISAAYGRLIKERDCTPEDQAGDNAWTCRNCGRIAVHPRVGICMACGNSNIPERYMNGHPPAWERTAVS